MTTIVVKAVMNLEILTIAKHLNMSRTKEMLEENWYEYQGRIELDWMEQEYFNYIANPKKQNYENKFENEKAVPYLESQRPYFLPTHENDKRDKGYRRTEGKGTKPEG